MGKSRPTNRVAIVLAAGLALAGSAIAEQNRDGAPHATGKIIETPVQMHKMLRVQINLSTGEVVQSEYEVPAPPANEPGELERADLEVGVDGILSCDETVTHTDANFGGGQFTVQAGFAQNEAAGASYTLTPSQFPLIFRSAEMVFATSLTNVTTTTEWSLLIFAGNPNNGTLVETFSSDGLILPHIIIPPGTNGVNVQVIVDPSDPDQVVIQNTGNATYSVAFRIDKHNNQTQNPCFFAPPTASNAFPTTDTSGLSQPTRNWLFAVSCPFLPGGWYRFSDLGILQPSGDWVIRSTYVPFDCTELIGACCFFDFCEQLASSQCALSGGIFLGAGTACSECDLGACCFISACADFSEADCADSGGAFQGQGTRCTDPGICEPGACCQPDGTCTSGVTAGGCLDLGGTFQGAGTDCGTTNCPDPTVPCCFPGSGGCFEISFQTCLVAGGIPGPIGQTCATFVCFPVGACCLPDGSCLNAVSPEDCNAAGGVFQGDATDCATTSCPLPTGACCLPNGACIVLIQSNCNIAGGSWAGAATNCADTNGSGTADACEDPTPLCPFDLNGDGIVDAADLGILLNAFGSNGPAGDINGDGIVDAADLGILLNAFGSTCP